MCKRNQFFNKIFSLSLLASSLIIHAESNNFSQQAAPQNIEIGKSNHRKSDKEDFKKALAQLQKEKENNKSLSEQEKRAIEWAERNFQEGKRECIEALTLNPDADLDKLIDDIEANGGGSKRLRPWAKRDGPLLRCNVLSQKLHKAMAVPAYLRENDDDIEQLWDTVQKCYHEAGCPNLAWLPFSKMFKKR